MERLGKVTATAGLRAVRRQVPDTDGREGVDEACNNQTPMILLQYWPDAAFAGPERLDADGGASKGRRRIEKL